MVMRYAGKDIHFEIEDASSVSRILTGITSVDGLPGRVEHHDATAVGDNGRKHAPSLENVTVTVEGWYDKTADTGAAVVLSGLAALRSAGQESVIIYGPQGNASTNEKFTATVKMDELTYPGRLGSLVGFRCTLLVQGQAVAGTFA
jgi:hypothetical protein